MSTMCVVCVMEGYASLVVLVGGSRQCKKKLEFRGKFKQNRYLERTTVHPKL